ncbi:MAG: rod shape-determining protein MreC [Candidatus Paceibacterota bacterium]
MNYLFKNKKVTRKFSKPVLVAVFFLIFIFVLNFSNPFVFSGFTHKAGAPFWWFGDVTRNFVFNVFSSFRFKQNLISENKFLQQENLILKSKLLNFNLVQNENIRLNEILNKNKNKNIVLGYVISWPPSSPYDTLIIDVGKNDKIEKKDKVFFGNIAVGEIYEIFGDSSLVYLFSTSGTKIEALLNDKTPVIAEGVGGGNFQIKVPKDIEVKEKDIINFTGVDKSILGIVEYIKTKPSDAFQEVFLRSPFNILEIRDVQVLRQN